MAQHPYCYPGTEILINKLDLRDPRGLKTAERLSTGARMATLLLDQARRTA